MGLKGSQWVKGLLRDNPLFARFLSHASYSRARNGERPPGAEGRKGPGVEIGYKVVVIELMLHKHKLVTGCQNLANYANKWRDLVANIIARFPDGETFVFLFDDNVNVPHAKGETQAKRGTGFTSVELAILGTSRYLCTNNPERFDSTIKALYSVTANEASMGRGRRTVSPFEHFMTKHMRTGSLREDEFEFATRWITAGAYAELGPTQRIVIDGGVWRNSFERSITNDPFNGGQESWEHVSASFRPTHDRLRKITSTGITDEVPDRDPPMRGWILIDGRGVRRISQLDGSHRVGEADLKLARYVRLFAARKDVYVVCHDTDALPILLLAVRDMVPRQGQITARITLDMTTPTDENPKRKKPPKNKISSNPDSPNYWDPDMPKLPPHQGVVDICGLWREIHHWYRKQFPAVRNPIESFVLFMIMMGTDYVNNPPRLGPVRIWKAYKHHELANNILGRAIFTDGRMGSALIEDDAEAIALLDPCLDDDTATATERMARCLLRRCDTGGFLRITGAAACNDDDDDCCTRGRIRRHLSLNEQKIERFLNMAYLKEGVKDVSKHPDYHWCTAQARRLGWQMAYWANGDTLFGRQRENEMLGVNYVSPQDANRGKKRIATCNVGGRESLHGWCWEPIPNDESKSPPKKRRKCSLPENLKNKGDLGRRKPMGYQSRPASRVTELRVFRQFMLSS